MIGAEIVSAANRVTPIHPETRPMWVQTQVAQQLGLRDGQVVQAMVEVRDKRVRRRVQRNTVPKKLRDTLCRRG